MRKRLFVRRCAVRTIFLQDIGHNGTTHPARASRATGAAKAPTRSLIFHFYRGHGPLLPPRPCSSGAGRARDGGPARSLAATGYAGRRSIRGCVPALERGNDQSCPKLMGSRRGRSLDQGIDIPFLSRAWPAPPRPCSSERAVPAMGDRHGLWYPEQGRTPERPGLGSHAGAWERSNAARSARFPGAPCTSSPRAHAPVVGAKNFSPLRTPPGLSPMVPPADGRWGGGLPRAVRHGHGWCGGGVGMVPRRRVRRARHLPRGE